MWRILKSIIKQSIFFDRRDGAITGLAQMVACLPLVQQIRGSIPGGVINFHLKIFNFGSRRDGDVHFPIARLYVTVLDYVKKPFRIPIYIEKADSTVDSDSSVRWGR